MQYGDQCSGIPIELAFRESNLCAFDKVSRPSSNASPPFHHSDRNYRARLAYFSRDTASRSTITEVRTR